VSAGGGLLMIGGYLSFTGFEARPPNRNTVLHELLPVELLAEDDPVELPAGATAQVLEPGHPALGGVSGTGRRCSATNRVRPRPGTSVLATVGADPLVAVAERDGGRTAVFTSDCSPHWAPEAFCEQWDGYPGCSAAWSSGWPDEPTVPLGATARHRRDSLDRALGMRFVREVGAGTISQRAYANYLDIEAAFVLTAARLHGFAVWDAPSWPAARRNGLAVHALVTEQAEYFRLGPLGLAGGRRARPSGDTAGGAAVRLRAGRRPRRRLPGDHDRAVRRRDAVLTWCTSAHHAGLTPAGPVADWVALHAASVPGRGRRAGRAGRPDPGGDPGQHPRRLVRRMLDAEITFHDAVYG